MLWVHVLLIVALISDCLSRAFESVENKRVKVTGIVPGEVPAQMLRASAANQKAPSVAVEPTELEGVFADYSGPRGTGETPDPIFETCRISPGVFATSLSLSAERLRRNCMSTCHTKNCIGVFNRESWPFTGREIAHLTIIEVFVRELQR